MTCTLPPALVRFFKKQHFVIVATRDRNGMPHTSCKGMVSIAEDGVAYLLDLYKWRTYQNLLADPRMSVTAVDEHQFKGWCLKGRGEIRADKELPEDIVRLWESKIAGRITHRVLKNIRDKEGHERHPEAQLPVPEYMIKMNIESIVDLIPHHVRKGEKGSMQ